MFGAGEGDDGMPIDDRRAAKSRAGHAAPKGKHARGGIRDRYYLTRDSSPDGTLSETVDVWLTQPIRHRLTAEGGAVWMPSDERTWRTFNHGSACEACAISLSECRERFGAVPPGDTVCLLLDEVVP